MSWSISLIGYPNKVNAALESHSLKLEGQSKVEFDEALPHLVWLVKQNSGIGNSPPVIKIDASGHSTVKDGEKIQSVCRVSIDASFHQLV